MSETTQLQTQQAVAPQSAANPKPAKELYPMVGWKYDSFLWIMSLLEDTFFREVHPRSAWRVPKHGPVLFVAAPHANQFVDALVLLRTLQKEAKRRVSLLIAQKSVSGFIGWASRQVGCVPVGRPQDSAKPGQGTVYLPNPVDDPTLVRGIGTNFTEFGEVGGIIFLPSAKGQSGESLDISEVIGPEEVRIKRPPKGKLAMSQLTGRDDVDANGKLLNKEDKKPREGYQGIKYKIAPHVDQSKVFQAVFDRLASGGCVGIFPEGGSHDRTELLPLKAGVALMALGTLADHPDCGLKIVPVGMNYFHAHKFRSRAVVEFGAPLDIPRNLVDAYSNGGTEGRREAVGQVLDMVHEALSAVTVSVPDYDTLMVIQAARRLYNPTGKPLPLPVVVELNRRLALGYEKYKEDPRVKELKEAVTEYNKQLRYLDIRDHQVEKAKLSWFTVVATFLQRVVILFLLSAGVIPGLLLFAPVFIACKVISHKKAKEALAGSVVKVQGKDVIATWKLLVALALAPLCYNTYAIITLYMVHKHRYYGWVPEWVPFWAVYIACCIFFILLTFAALRFGEVGMDILKSLRPLALCINPASSYNVAKLRERRAELKAQVTDIINTIGPEMFPDFEHSRLLAPADSAARAAARREAGVNSPPISPNRPSYDRRSSYGVSVNGSDSPPFQAPTRRNTTSSSRNIPYNESFSNIAQAQIFATRPTTPSNHSRASSSGGRPGSAGFPVAGFTTLDSAEGFDEASKKIRAAMKERGEMRRRKSQARQFMMGDEGTSEEDGSDGVEFGDRRKGQ
ncbi:Glycerol-3-phosphate/dihydroxyacetone phosphate acyltransferase [Podospora pseudoanserina]|uniref:Glycerol-3-phosphate/dihydroxyacetone phosphate acyltransferase n=1 Tax=Podospora pseudoanserina TaxID=2609844 RepID=A0ABR0IAE5_9PEZI|nr:Glycerol-3-phosphate/dihydroxyacetone phosphate acyltransferase [Podospora pseudoanserina]